MLSLSSADHSEIAELAKGLADRYEGEQVALSLPSTRVDAFNIDLANELSRNGRRSGLTFAPEGGSERIRQVINKMVTEEDLIRTVTAAYGAGWRQVKLYFMCGLPTETDADVEGMAVIALRIRDEVMKPRARATGRMGRITLSVNPFVPKPWTPFQWAPMHDAACLAGKRRLLERRLRPQGIEVEFLSPREAYVQTLLSRGDRRCADLLERALLETGGSVQRALALWPHDPEFFVTREVGVGERLPWDFIDHGLTKSFLAREYRRGVGARITPKCDLGSCRACGLDCADHPELRPPAPAPGVHVP
jgi:hypothetical protein